MKTKNSVVKAGFAFTAAATLVLLTSAVAPRGLMAGNDEDNDETTLVVDVAQIGSSNAQNNIDPLQPKELFARGDTAIIAGTIYAGRKLQRGKQENDPTEPGIGKYTFRATYTGPPTDFPINAFATECFEFPDSGSSLLTDGLWPAEGATARRVVLGGTGRYRYAVGEAVTENLGANKDTFCNLRVRFKLRKVANGNDRN